MNELDALTEVQLLWPDYRPTPLLDLPDLARLAEVGHVFVKVESARPLGNFKSLGGLIAGIRALSRACDLTFEQLIASDGDKQRLRRIRLVCASDGNHGLAVAAAAKRTGALVSVYLPAGVSIQRIARLEALGATVISVVGTYDDAVATAEQAADQSDNLLISDTGSDPEHPVVRDVMEGYAVMTTELKAQFFRMRTAPTHLFVQAGVGALAAALADGLHEIQDMPGKVVVVEPEVAACVGHALELGHPESVTGGLETCASMLSCGTASAMAVRILIRCGTNAIQVSEEALQRAPVALAHASGLSSTASGAAGLAGLLRTASDPRLRADLGLEPDSRVLLVATEGQVPAASVSDGPVPSLG